MNEHEMWYWMTKMKLAKLGVNVGEEFFPSLQTEADKNGMSDMFDFASPEEYRYFTSVFTTQAALRGEATDELNELLLSIMADDNISIDDDDTKIEAWFATLKKEAIAAAKASQ